MHGMKNLNLLFYVLFVCKWVLPPGDNPIRVNKYIISYHIISYHITSYHYAFQNVRFRFYFTFKHKKNIFSLQDLRENSYLAIRSAHKWRVWEALAQDELSHCPTYMYTGLLHVLNMRVASSFKISLSGGGGGEGGLVNDGAVFKPILFPTRYFQ